MQEFHFKNTDFYYSAPEYIEETSIILSGDEFIHLTKVMRKKINDIILIVDGLGFIYECKIVDINKSNLSADILSKNRSTNETGLNITLALGLLKNPSKYDFVVEKTTELGVKKIIPFTSKFTIAQKPKIDRWQNLAVAAMKQSQRAFLPVISECLTFKNLLKIPADIKLIADIDSEKIYGKTPNTNSEVIILVGPEGGFSADEISEAIEAGFKKFNLSTMRLRAETAAIASIPLLIERLGE
jgi:16S rRNA (uracil1498-N3)-methyltransferase